MASAVAALRKLRNRRLNRFAVIHYRRSNRELLRRKQAERYHANPELFHKRTSESNKRHRDRRRVYGREYDRTHKDSRKRDKVSSRQRNLPACQLRERERARRDRLINGEKIRDYHRKYRPAWRAKQMRENPQFVLKDRLRSALLRGLRQHGLKKTARTEAMVGCTLTELRKHIESQFVNGMSWNNLASFSIDHTVPLRAFNLLDDEERYWSFNWQNLRPMDLNENKKKSDTIPNPLPAWLPVHIATRILERQK